MEVGATAGTVEVHKIDSAPARTQAQGQTSASGLSAGDSVSLTDGARQLQDVQSVVAATPVVDSERVAGLREAIANGSYHIDPQRIADGLLAQDRAALE